MIPNDSHETTRPPRMSDSEATRAAGMTSEQRVRAAILDAKEMTYEQGWRAGIYGSVAGRETWMGYSWDDSLSHPSVVAYEAQHRLMREQGFDIKVEDAKQFVRENLEDLMRDTTDAVSGEKPKCGVPQYAGSNLCTLDDGHGGDHECHRGVMIHCWPKGTPYPVAPDSGKDAFEEWYKATEMHGWDETEYRVAQLAWNAALESKPAP